MPTARNAENERQTMKATTNTRTYTVWLFDGDENDSSTKIVDVVEGFKSESQAVEFGQKAVSNRPGVVDYKVGFGY